MKTKVSYLLIVSMCIISAGSAFAVGVEIADGIGSGLIGYWAFDDLTEGVLRNSARVGLDAGVRGDVLLEDGVFAAAACFKGQHTIRIKANNAFENLPSITISAWVSPKELSGYREIFRKEDGNKRILFSFQNGGRILSLGLNVEGSGYEELDAAVQPALLTDIQWHYVAGTFDGEKMRVYLDGLEIGSRRKPGRIISGGGADAFIGSMAGTGEFFHGLIDDLRIFNIALTDDQIAKLYEEGLSAILAKVEGYQEQIENIYEEKVTFAETMAATRRNLKDKNVPSVLMRLVQAKLTARFSKECVDFSEATNSQAFEYLAAADNSLNLSKTEHLMGLVTEYKPLTQQQWARLNETGRKKWEEVEQLITKFERLKRIGEAGTCEADWINLMMEAEAKVVHRPVQHEAVAPYVKAYTPQTRDYSAKEAEDMLRKDWLFQTNGGVTVHRIKSEIGWTREVVARIKQKYPDRVDFSKELSELKVLEDRGINDVNEQLYYAVRSIKRRVMFGNPSWGAAYHPPDNPPAGFGIADTILVEAYDQRDPAAYVTPEPMTKLSYKSRLVDIAASGKHYDVKVDELSRRKLIAWVDTMCPYRGDEEVRQIDDPEFQGIDWLAIRPQIKNAPVVVRPGPIDHGL